MKTRNEADTTNCRLQLIFKSFNLSMYRHRSLTPVYYDVKKKSVQREKMQTVFEFSAYNVINQ